MAYLEGKNLVASYGVVPILHECSVEVEKGELAVIVGPNGAGKSTVMRVLLGMLDASAGSVTLDGNDISREIRYFKLRKNSLIHTESFPDRIHP